MVPLWGEATDPLKGLFLLSQSRLVGSSGVCFKPRNSFFEDVQFAESNSSLSCVLTCKSLTCQRLSTLEAGDKGNCRVGPNSESGNVMLSPVLAGERRLDRGVWGRRGCVLGTWEVCCRGGAQLGELNTNTVTTNTINTGNLGSLLQTRATWRGWSAPSWSPRRWTQQGPDNKWRDIFAAFVGRKHGSVIFLSYLWLWVWDTP